MENIVEDPENISTDDETEFGLTALYGTITKAINSNSKCMKRVFSRLLE